MRNAIVYVDGLNLFYGLRSKGWRRYYWLDMRRLAERLLLPDQTLVAVRYFTARVSAEPDDPLKPHRQNTYLEALATLPGVSLHYGRHLRKRRRCPECGAIWAAYEEKMTDVNIAAALLGDAAEGAFDTAILISADSDLVGPVEMVRRSGKEVAVAFPPARRSYELRHAATATIPIGRGILQQSQLPERIRGTDGAMLERPASWKR